MTRNIKYVILGVVIILTITASLKALFLSYSIGPIASTLISLTGLFT